MTRPLPVPLPEPSPLPASSETVPVSDRLWTLVRWADLVAPVVRALLERRSTPSVERRMEPASSIVALESLHIHVLEHSDGTREWTLTQIVTATPRRSLRPGRLFLALPALGLLAIAMSRGFRAWRFGGLGHGRGTRPSWD